MLQHRKILIFQFLLIALIFQITPTFAGLEPLPPIPNSAILNQVINQTGGPTFTPLNAPTSFRSQLAAFSGVLDNVENRLDYAQAVSYFDRSGNLMELVIPLSNNRSAVLDPDITAPGQYPMPGKIVGALWQRGRGLMVMVALFQQGGNSLPPTMFRFYFNSTQYYDAGLLYSVFVDYFNDGRLEAVDEGGIIAAYNSCLSVGLEQICWTPYLYEQVRDQMSKDRTQAALVRAQERYQLLTSFAIVDTVPDLIGAAFRTNCANQLRTASSFDSLSYCRPNLIMTQASSMMAGQPRGIWVVTATADLKAYRSNGIYTGSVPAGEYLVIDATPNLSSPGQVGVLFLVNINSNNHYLIPSVMMQSFASNSQITEWQAAIKDGTMSFRGF
jgi:hypothetical protein